MYRKLMYFDIETAGKWPDLETMREQDPRAYRMFETRRLRRTDQIGWTGEPGEVYRNQCSLLAEYGKIVCASFGFIHGGEFKIKSFTGDEEGIVRDSCKLFNNAAKAGWRLSGFNIKGFDIPWFNKKCHRYGIDIPGNINFFGKKPWEIDVVELSEVWNCVSGKYASFDEACYELDIESPKEGFGGADVHPAYWEGDVEEIREYCERDVRALVELAKRILP